MLCIFTRSDDGTVNLIENLFDESVLRINVDSDDWGFDYRNGDWTIHAGEQSIKLDQDSRAWWWKVYFEDDNRDRSRNAEIEYLTREIYSEIGRRGKLVGNPPNFHSQIGKLRILDIARKIFSVPETNATFNRDVTWIDDAVVKSLSSTPFTNNTVLYTTRASVASLNPNGNFWLTQSYVESAADVTVLLVGFKTFAFERRRTPGITVDWRREQVDDLNRTAWTCIQMSKFEKQQIRTFQESLGVEWGRIDFLRSPQGELVFLEYNANGQFVFLDEKNRSNILSEVAQFLVGSCE